MTTAALLDPLLAGGLAAAGAALATPALARVAPRLGLVDAPVGAAAARKLQLRPVPAVGGAAVLLGLLAGAALTLRAGLHGGLAPGAWGGAVLESLPRFPGPGGMLCALALAFLVGLVDDLLPGGLSPGRKLAGQALAGLSLGAPALLAAATGGGGWPGAVVFALGACALSIVAMNAVNTFDNTDGGAGLLGAAALAGPLPLAAGALLGFLPFNVDRRSECGARVRPDRGESRGERRGGPTSYLGDSGSHLVGMLIVLTPVAWPALALPIIDLLRLAVVRTRSGSLPWVGDRRHLAHRCEAAGLSRPAVLGALSLVALPSVVMGGWGTIAGSGWLVAAGVAGTAVLYAGAVRLTSRIGR